MFDENMVELAMFLYDLASSFQFYLTKQFVSTEVNITIKCLKDN